MATANTTFTQEQINKLSDVAKKYGGFENSNFKAAIDTQYGSGSYDSLYKSISDIRAKQQQTSGTDVRGQVSTQTPVGAQSMTAPTPQPQPVQQPTTIQQPDQYQTLLSQGYSPDEARRQMGQIQPVSTPQTTTTPKTTENVATTQKTDVPEDIKVKQQQGLDMLNKIVQTNPELAGNYEALKKATGYDKLDQNGRQLVDAFYQARSGAIGTQEGIFGILAQGQPVYNQDILRTPAYQEAKARFDAVGQFKGASTDTLFNSMVGNRLSPESPAWQDLIKVNGGIETPEMQQAKIKYENKKKIDRINRNGEILSGSYSEPKDTLIETSNEIIQSKGMDYATEFKKDIQENPELKRLSEEVSSVTLQIKDLEDQKALTIKKIREQRPGLSMGAALLLASKENQAIDEQLNQLYNKQSVASSNLKYQSDMAMKMFDYKMLKAKEERDVALESAKDTREFNQAKQLAEFQQGLSLKGKQAEFEQQMEQKAKIASDPVLATQEVIDQYRKLGVLAQRSDAEIIQSVKNDISGGMTLGQSLTNLNKAFQSKPEYQAIQSKKNISGKNNYITVGGQLYDINTKQFIGPFTGDTQVGSGTTTNRPDRNNNPGNVKIGDVGYGVDDQNHTIFGSAEEGYKAMVNDLTAKLTGKSKWGLTGESTLADLGKIYAEDPKWSNSVAKLSGYSTFTKLKDIDVNKLAPAVAKQEGFTGQILPKTPIKKTADTTQKPLGVDAGKVLGYTTTGISLADNLLNKLKGMSAREFITKVKVEDPDVFNDVRLLADSIIRLRTGAAATKDEVNTFAGGIASTMNMFYNDKSSIEKVLNTYKTELDNTRRALTEGAGSILSSQQSSINANSSDSDIINFLNQ